MIEAEMMRDGFDFLSNKKEYKMVKCEVPFLSRCIDVVLVDQNDRIISIEFKISKWRHAIEQAINHKLGADSAYVCLPKRKITDTLASAIKTAGIGLLIYDPDSSEKISVAIPAPDRSKNVAAFRDILMLTLTKI